MGDISMYCRPCGRESRVTLLEMRPVAEYRSGRLVTEDREFHCASHGYIGTFQRTYRLPTLWERIERLWNSHGSSSRDGT
jgi:hypothetical protein